MDGVISLWRPILSILTKVFIVLALVCSLTLSVFVILTLSQQEKYRTALQSESVAKVGAQAMLAKMEADRNNYRDALDRLRTERLTSDSNYQAQIRNLQNTIATSEREIATKGNDLNNAQASVTALTTANQAMTDTLGKLNTELAQLRQDVPVLTQRNAELNRHNNELQTGLDSAQNAIRRLQEELAEAQQPQPQKTPTTGAQGPSETTTPTLSALVPINGKVERVDTQNGRTFLTLSIGKRDSIQENYRFTIYRGNSYIGDAVVRKVAVDQSVAEVTMLKPGQQVQATDLAISGPGQ
jgi:hypothetical protein